MTDLYFIQCNSVRYKKANRTKKNIKFIVVHYTGNNGDTARNNLINASREGRQASAHFFVDEKEVCQSVLVEDIAWHCGTSGKYKHAECRNANSIGVEMCSRMDKDGDYYFLPETVENTAKFVSDLMKEYGIPPACVVRHYDVTGKLCPRPYVDEIAWAEFKTLVLKYYTGKDVENEVEEVKRYKTVEDVPAWAKPYIKTLVEKGFIAGTDDGSLDLSYDMVRMLIITGRMNGVF